MLGNRQESPEETPWGCLSGVAETLQVSIDPNGNLASKTEGTDSWGYEWNANNELTRVTKNSVEQARFSYDPFGRRVEKVAGGITTTNTYDGGNVLREVRGSTTLNYVHGPGVDEPLAVDDGTALSYFHAEGLGSIVRVTNASGSVTLTRQYDAWGNLELGASERSYAFTAREWDPETGLYYYRARHYDPKQGRFISEDPIGFDGGEDFYAYVENAPTNKVDPSGLESGRTFTDVWKNPGPDDRMRPPYAPYTCAETCGISFRNCRLLHVPPAFVGGVVCRWVCKVGAPSFRVICSLICTAGATSTSQSEYARCYAQYKECLMKCSPPCESKK